MTRHVYAEHDKLDTSQKEEILLDENKEAEKHSFYMVRGFEPSPNHRLLTYAEDTTGWCSSTYTCLCEE